MTARVENETDLIGMRAAGRAAASVLEMIGDHVQPGVTTEELDQLCHRFIVEDLHCIPAPLNYGGGGGQMPFPKSICTSVNNVVCHGIPSPSKKLKNGDVIQRHAESNYFSVVREFCGHGIAKVFHDEPQVLHYGRPGTGVVLDEGMSFTIEPMINAGKRHIKILSDQWTAVTKDHKLSAQWEHTLMVTADGYEIFTLREEESFA